VRDSEFEKLVLRDELQQLWQGKDVFTEVQRLQGDIARKVPGRETLRFQLGANVYYRKLHTGVGWGEIIKNLLQLRLPIVGADNEWQALNRLAQLRVPSLTPVAYGKKCRNPARQLSFIVTRELSGTVELDKYLHARREQPLSFRHRYALLRELASITRRLHRDGINHRDLYLCHFLLEPQSMDALSHAADKPLIYLVDLHRAQIRAQVPRRWLIKDLASIYFSALDLGVTRRDVWRFLRIYFDRPLASIIQQHQRLLEQIERRARKLYRREQRLKKRDQRHQS
jgi:hypothetical protein